MVGSFGEIFNSDEEELLLLRDIINSIPAAIVICKFTAEFEIVYANDGLFRMIGYTPAQFLLEKSNCLLGIFSLDDVDRMSTTHERQLLIGNTVTSVVRIVRRDGKVLWAKIGGIVKKKATGELEFRGVINDITEQKKQEEALLISEKRYEIAIKISGVTIFDYNVRTKQMIHHHSDIEKYNLPRVMNNAVETLISSGTIHPSSVTDFREMYEKIDNGAEFAQAIINTVDENGDQFVIQISLTTVFDNDHKPIRAIGVKRDITKTIQLKKEREFGNSLASDKHMTYEANISRNIIVKYDNIWLRDIGIKSSNSYTTLIDTIVKDVIHPDYKDLFSHEMSCETILKNYDDGKRLSSFQYRKRRIDGIYMWFEKTVNIIKDDATGDIFIRCYIVDINARKEKENRISEEQQFYETMVNKSVAVYESNITQNVLISGHEWWKNLFGFDTTNDYSEMIAALSKKAIHPDDRIEFAKTFERENLLNAFSKGTREAACEYRRPDESGEFIWVRCSVHLFEDPSTGNVRGRTYVENIDIEKRKEIELIYKSEHDALTAVYSKGAVREKINSFLATSEAKAGVHALLMLDIDYFKSVNDNFGHVFGDIVLSKVATNVKKLFRDNDIIGRIGGDEFIILMKNLISRKDALVKAQEICDCVVEAFSKNGVQYKISGSVGVAFYNEHGRTYDELYNHSDSALYYSKECGRAMFSVYNTGMGSGFSTPGEINSNTLYEPKSFSNNIVEYVFRILYDAVDRKNAIESVVTLIGKHYNVGRVYVLEDSEDGECANNTFEWCSDGVVSQMERRQEMNYADAGNYKAQFSDNGVIYMRTVGDDAKKASNFFICDDVKSLIQFSFARNGEFKGIIGLDECDYIRISTKKELSEMQNVISVLGMFIIEMRENEKLNLLISASQH